MHNTLSRGAVAATEDSEQLLARRGRGGVDGPCKLYGVLRVLVLLDYRGTGVSYNYTLFVGIPVYAQSTCVDRPVCPSILTRNQYNTC